MNTSGVIQLNKTSQVILIGLVVGGIIWFKMSSRGSGSSTMEVGGASVAKVTDVVVKEVKDLKVDVNGEAVIVAYRETSVDKPKMDILFLHGQAFKSLTWVSEPMWTLQHFGKLGYRTVAIDLPGFGDSPRATPDPAAFLEAVIRELKLNAPVIVSPSMSGSYSLPYLFKDTKHVLSRCRGYIPVAPVYTENYTAKQYASLQVPALVIYGEKDVTIGKVSLNNFKNLPKKTIVELEGARHPCYLDRPDEFHSHMEAFLEKIR
ncbi:Protein abhd14b [Mactra antiquata]